MIIWNLLQKSYCASFVLGLHQREKGEGCPPRSHSPLHQMMCFGTVIAGTAAGRAEPGGSAAVAGCCGCAVSSHSSGGPTRHSERAWIPRGFSSL